MERLPTPAFWPGEFHGLYSPWGRKELDTTERLSLHFHFLLNSWESNLRSTGRGPRFCILKLALSHPFPFRLYFYCFNYQWKVTQLCPTLCDPMDSAYQASLSMGFSRQAYWSGLPFPSPGDLLDPEIKHWSLVPQADSLPTDLWGKPKSQIFFSLKSLSRVQLLVTPWTIYTVHGIL